MKRHPRRRHVRRLGALSSGRLRLYLTTAGILAALLLLLLLLRPSAQLLSAPEIARAQRLGVLRVGVLSNMPGFSSVINGEGDGLEIALAHALSREIFPDVDPDISVELVEVNRYTAISRIKNGNIDIAFAMQRNTGDSALTYSNPYYTDEVRLLCRAGSEAAAVYESKVGMIEGSEAAAAWKAYDLEHDAALSAEYFASYPDMATALRAGRVEFIAVPGAFVNGLLSDGLALHPTVLGNIGYVAVSAAESPAFALLADIVIQRMQRNGEMDALIAQYGLRAQ